MNAIHIDGLTKVFKPGWPWQAPTMVLSGVSFSVNRGEIFGFLGPNGAGKTTTLKILLGLSRATSGRVEILGVPASDVTIHRRVGFLPESPYFYDYLTAEEFLGFYGRLGGLSHGEIRERVPALLEQAGLTDARDRQLRKFSKGMLQRIGLAQALIHDPELVILDEPMSGLDPIGRKWVRDLILNLRDRGKTIFFSTHILSDVEMLCDRVAILQKGQLLASGRIEELVKQGVSQTIEVVYEGGEPDKNDAMKPLAARVLRKDNRCLLVLHREDVLDEVLTLVRQQGGKLISVTPHKGALEELFIRKTG